MPDLVTDAQNKCGGDGRPDSIMSLVSSAFCEDLFFVTKQTPLDNMSSKLFNIILHSIATGIQYDDGLETCEDELEELRVKLLGDAELTTPHLCTWQLLKTFDTMHLWDQLFVVVGNSSHN